MTGGLEVTGSLEVTGGVMQVVMTVLFLVIVLVITGGLVTRIVQGQSARMLASCRDSQILSEEPEEYRTGDSDGGGLCDGIGHVPVGEGGGNLASMSVHFPLLIYDAVRSRELSRTGQ